MDPLLGLAAKFIEQGGLQILVGLWLLTVAVAGWIVARLFGALQQAHASYAVLLERCITALEDSRTSQEATTRAVEAQGEVSRAMHLALAAHKDAVEMLTRVVERRGR